MAIPIIDSIIIDIYNIMKWIILVFIAGQALAVEVVTMAIIATTAPNVCVIIL